MSHPLPDDVLVELGKLTWAAIRLEDLADSLCNAVRHANPREDRRGIGQKIKDARRDLKTWEEAPEVVQVDSWLARAGQALERRNAILHSVPLRVFDRDGGDIGFALGEMPRGDHSYFERHVTVEALQEVRNELEHAQQGWRNTVLLASRLHP